MELALLKTLVMTVELGSQSDAARRLGVTPSAVSQQLKMLEARLGVPLFQRVGRRSVPTPAAQEIVVRLREPFVQIDRAVSLLRSDFHEIRGPLSIGAPRPFGSIYLRPRALELLRAYPELELELVFDVPSVLEARLVSGELDLAILVEVAEHPGVSTTSVAHETFVCVGAPAYLEGSGRPQTLDEFSRHRYIAYDRDMPMHRPWWRASFGARASAEVRVACYAASLPEMLAFAEAGVGLTVLPDYLIAPALARGSLERLAPADPLRTARNAIYVGWRTNALESARLLAVREALSAPLVA